MQRCQRETTSTEFLEWIRYRELDMETHRREDYYLAQIAAECHRSVAKHPNSVKLEQFLLKLTLKKAQKEKPLTEEVKAVRLANSKAAWFGAVGLPIPKG